MYHVPFLEGTTTQSDDLNKSFSLSPAYMHTMIASVHALVCISLYMYAYISKLHTHALLHI